MQVLYERCAAVDVGKDVIAVAVRRPGRGRDGRVTDKRTYKTFYGVLREMARSLTSEGVTHVAMEATGVYSMPVYHALIEHGGFERVLVCSAGHVKNAPGRKTDLADAEWLAQLLECGLLAGSFIPPAEVKAIRDLIRYRAKIARQRVSGDRPARRRDAGRRDQDRLGRLVHRDEVRAGDDRGADRRGAARAGARGPGDRPDGEQDPGPVDGAGRPVRRAPRDAVPPAPGPHRPPAEDDRRARYADRGDDAAVSRRPRPADHDPGHRGGGSRRGDLRDRPGPPAVLPDGRSPGVLGRLAPATTSPPANASRSAVTATPTCSPCWPRSPGPRSDTPATSNRSTAGTLCATAATGATARNKAIITVAHAILVIIWHVLATGTPYDDLGADYFDRRTDPDREAQRLIARLEALGRHVTVEDVA